MATFTAQSDSAIPTRTELFARAEALVPVLAERAAKCEELRRVPDETLADFHSTGLFRMLQPRRFGGSELDYGDIVELGAVTARGCGSSGWVFGNLAVHHWMLAIWPAEAQHEVWDEDPDALIGSAFAFPCGRATKVDGGYRVRGRWPFSSGIDPSTWVMVGAMVDPPEGQTAPEARMFLVPMKDFKVIDNWFVAGLRGTGSKDVAIDDMFVPAHRTLAVNEAKGGPNPGTMLNPNPNFQLPLIATFAYTLTGVALGIAQGAINTFCEGTRQKVAKYNNLRVAELTTVQLRVAEAAASVDAGMLLMLRNCAEALRTAAAGETPTLEQRTRYRRDGAFAGRLAAKAVDLIFECSGGAGLFDSHPIQRSFRDVHACTSHIALNFDVAGTTYGKVMLGLPCDNPLL